MLATNCSRRIVAVSFVILSLSSSWFQQQQDDNNQVIDAFASALSTASPSTQSKRVELGTLSVSPMGFGTLNLPLDKTEGDDNTVQVVKAAHAAGN